jgi:hypothetical protein
VLATIAARTVKADLDKFIRTAPRFLIVGLTWPIRGVICTEFTVTIRCICARGAPTPENRFLPCEALGGKGITIYVSRKCC